MCSPIGGHLFKSCIINTFHVTFNDHLYQILSVNTEVIYVFVVLELFNWNSRKGYKFYNL